MEKLGYTPNSIAKNLVLRESRQYLHPAAAAGREMVRQPIHDGTGLLSGRPADGAIVLSTGKEDLELSELSPFSYLSTVV